MATFFFTNPQTGRIEDIQLLHALDTSNFYDFFSFLLARLFALANSEIEQTTDSSITHDEVIVQKGYAGKEVATSVSHPIRYRASFDVDQIFLFHGLSVMHGTLI